MLFTLLWTDGFIQVGPLANLLNFFTQIAGPTGTTFKFKLEVGTGCTKHYACSLTYDPCHTTFKGYRWVLLYVGKGHLFHLI